jgi:hypothetical protein
MTQEALKVEQAQQVQTASQTLAQSEDSGSSTSASMLGDPSTPGTTYTREESHTEGPRAADGAIHGYGTRASARRQHFCKGCRTLDLHEWLERTPPMLY